MEITPKGVPHLAKCNARATREVPSSKLKEQPPHRKIGVTSNLPVGRISVVTLIRTDTTLDHSQKAEKVCRWSATDTKHLLKINYKVLFAIPTKCPRNFWAPPRGFPMKFGTFPADPWGSPAKCCAFPKGPHRKYCTFSGGTPRNSLQHAVYFLGVPQEIPCKMLCIT